MKYYLYGSHFILQTDHQTLLTALKENRGNKTYQSRLTRWVDWLLPFNFIIKHVPGLSRNPSGEAIPPSDEDKNFVINTIDEIKFRLLRKALSPNGVNQTTNQSADTKQVANDVINPKQTSNTASNAFCLNSIENKSLSASHYIHPLNSINSNHIDSRNLVAITTRQNPLRDTFEIPIRRRDGAPNKQKIPQMDHTETPKSFKLSSTQTEYTSNKGKGLDP